LQRMLKQTNKTGIKKSKKMAQIPPQGVRDVPRSFIITIKRQKKGKKKEKIKTRDSTIKQRVPFIEQTTSSMGNTFLVLEKLHSRSLTMIKTTTFARKKR